MNLLSSEIDLPKLEALKKVVSEFNNMGDALLTDVFSEFYKDQKFKFDIVATSGVPAPYDAWMVPVNGLPVIFFNLSEWTVDELHSSGLAVVIHEVTHALLHPLLKKHPIRNFLLDLEKIVIDEGLAHFIGFPGNRDTLLEKWNEKWIAAEKQLEHAFIKLDSDQISLEEKEEIILNSNTGKFWEKYGSVSGMFRAAKIYSKKGSEGLIQAIKTNELKKY